MTRTPSWRVRSPRGAKGSLDDVRDHDAPWGVHRQGHFLDPFGHMWLVGDRSPLNRFG